MEDKIKELMERNILHSLEIYSEYMTNKDKELVKSRRYTHFEINLPSKIIRRYTHKEVWRM